ncbi:MAG TPA: imidazole glycerol phosphate synthase subunit HisH [Caulobacteraceae bacterium]|nr:imidazole glycerol phosphate synthase subunit HisH [Caulobacteraceae bacterium]
MRTVVLIDYGSGNLRSAEKALWKAAAEISSAVAIRTTSNPEEVAVADAIVLPGVGAFAACRSALYAIPGLVEAMSDCVKRRAAPFLGVCVGMQLLATRGLEFIETPGLDWIPGDVRRLASSDPLRKVPHMGWNTLDGQLTAPLFTNLTAGSHMYFTHSFAFDAADPGDVAAWTDHGGPIIAAVVRDNIAGVQFHPEKSQAPGQVLLRNFLEWRP